LLKWIVVRDNQLRVVTDSPKMVQIRPEGPEKVLGQKIGVIPVAETGQLRRVGGVEISQVFFVILGE
jgi:hypothetical protein